MRQCLTSESGGYYTRQTDGGGDQSQEGSMRRCEPACEPPWETLIRRGLASSATGMVRLRTPSR